MTVAELDALPEAEARATLERLCGARRWIETLLARRPFGDAETLRRSAESAFDALERADWLEAFAHHPKIGDVEALRTKFAATAAWAGGEQQGAAAASEETLARLAAGNRDYERRFGYIFIVCATGKSAGEMLSLLEARIGNDPAAELAIAADEQRKITRLRIGKLLEGR